MSSSISVHEIEEFTPPAKLVNLAPIVDSAHYLRLAICLLFVGLSVMAWFFLYPRVVKSNRYIGRTRKEKRSLVKEVSATALSSIFLGLGTMFLLLWSGINL